MNVDLLLDPDVAALLAEGPILETFTPENLPVIRTQILALAEDYETKGAAEITDHFVPSAGGARLAVRVHRPRGVDRPLPAIVWLHGGGMVAGSHLIEDARFDRWCAKLPIVGVAVDYGLAPERPYPGPLDDSYAALTWAFDRASELGIRRDCIGIGGASAGGNLAAATTLLARDRGELPVAFQALMYPMLDDRMTTASSRWDVPIWPPASNDFAWNAYLGGRRGEPDVSAYAAPARATDLAGLPATFIGVGAVDGFVDESIEYATRLLHSGSAVELHVYPGAPHGFDLLMPRTSVARRSRHHLDEWLGARLLETGERAGRHVAGHEPPGAPVHASEVGRSQTGTPGDTRSMVAAAITSREPRTNASAVAAAFEEWVRTGSARAVFRLTTVDVVWRVPGGAPSSGTYTSRDAFLASARTFTDRLAAPLAVTLVAVHDAGEHVVVEWRGTSTGMNGRPYDQRYCWVLRFVGQQIAEVTAYADTALVHAMFED